MKFSVIMPSLLADFPGAATKKEQKIIRAIKSVLAQSFTDFELIVVDDGSTDGTGAVCDLYAARDPRVRAVHQKNYDPG